MVVCPSCLLGFPLQLFFPFLMVDCSFFLTHVLPLTLLLLYFLSLCLLCNSLFGFFLLILLENFRYVVLFRFPVFFFLFPVAETCLLFVRLYWSLCLFFFFLWIFDVYSLPLTLMSVHLLFFLSRTKLMLGTGSMFRLFFVKLWFVAQSAPHLPCMLCPLLPLSCFLALLLLFWY